MGVRDDLIRLGGEATLWHDRDEVGYATISVNGHSENHCIRRRGYRDWLIRGYYRKYEGTPGGQAATEAIAVIDAQARFDGPEHKVALRISDVNQGWRTSVGG